MALSGYADKLLAALSTYAAPKGADPAVFRAFVEGVARQIRAPFAARHSAASALDLIALVWTVADGARHEGPTVGTDLARSVTRLITVMPDQPFIVDTVRLAVTGQGGAYLGSFNVVLGVRRDAHGHIVGVGGADDPVESMVLMEAEGLDPDDLPAFGRDLSGQLRLAGAMVSDFQGMIDLVDAAAFRFSRVADRTPDRAETLREVAEFLRWLLADNFVLMAAVQEDAALGFARPARAEDWSIDALQSWPNDDRSDAVMVRKGSQPSPVHRAGRVDEIRVLIPTTAQDSDRVLYLQGLFTYRAVTQPSRHVPLLRRTLAEILRGQESRPGSYRYKGIANVFDSLPTEFLFTAPTETITAIIEKVLEAEQEHDVRVHVAQNPTMEGAFVVAAMQRSRWSDRLRSDVQSMLVETTGGTVTDHGVFVGRYQTMLVHYYLTDLGKLDADVSDTIAARLQELATPWANLLHRALVERFDESAADELIIRYGTAFASIYQQVSAPERTARDIEMLERLDGPTSIEADLFRDPKGRINLRIYQASDIILSDILPVLDDFGVSVVDQFSDEVHPGDGPARIIDTFRLQGVWGLADARILERGDLLIAGLKAVFEQRMPPDVLNRILMRASVPWQAVDMLRAYNGYARQLGLRYTLIRIQEILLAQPELVGLLWEFFQAKFDPARRGSRKKAIDAASEALLDALREVADHDQDVTFRTLHNLIDATLRTNFYRTDRIEHYISLKIDCSVVRQMPSPRMKFEIYVHHRAVEGVHLRGGDIARGGIRWSDREDYRREVLDLVSTQMVKNVLIVPEGAKGGFFMKHSKGDPSMRRKRADELYQIFIRGLLDVTDNIVDGKVVHPPDVVIHDDDDPYLVVAADKGTAHLSDTANGLSRAYGFWLDDAFASGGSNGYDHKKVGITARGGWMTVRRLMQEAGLDPNKDSFTCVGVGDCGGDVFGNGVIEHETMRLVAAFNHRHIFIDPNPDPKSSYKERVRLFKAAKGWDAYDTSKLSAGGGIFSRRAKSVALSPEIQSLLGVLKTELPVDVVIRLLLRLNVDLLWNGGIGTYVKASHESDLDANDPTNDDYRVNANELRCRIVGEGGNLGFTQAGRIEYALHGGRINTDAIDNSGGVDMSDHEVNLKILLAPMVESGALGIDARNTLLEELTDQVADDVLANNDLHGRQLSVDHVRSVRDPMFFSRTIDWVCQHSGVARTALSLPSDDDLARRAASRQGLTRPELAVLQAHVKMHVFKALKATDASVIPGFDQKVLSYFPDRVRDTWPGPIGCHMLAHSIGMTVVTNEVIADSGAQFFPLLTELTGQPIGQIARAWYKAVELVSLQELREALNRGAAPLEARYRAWADLTEAMMGLVGVWLSAGEPGPDAEDLGLIKHSLKSLGRCKGTAHEARIRTRTEAYVSRKIARPQAKHLALLSELTVAREIARAHDGEERLANTVIRYVAIGEASRLLPAIRALGGRRAQGGWDPVAIGILRNRYIRLLRDLVRVVEIGPEVRLGVDRVATRLGREDLRDLQQLMDHILGEQPSIAALLVAEERVRAWTEQRRQTVVADA